MSTFLHDDEFEGAITMIQWFLLTRSLSPEGKLAVFVKQ